MAYYLQMDGVDDWLKAPSMTYDELIIDCVVTVRTDFRKYFQGSHTGYLQRTGSNTDQWSTGSPGWNQVYIDGVAKTNLTDFVPLNQRIILRATGTSTANTGGTGIFAQSSGANPVGGKIYNVKFYNGGVLQAHYDMTLGNVNDQSGNGRNATLTGGTWVEDGSGGTTYTGSGTAAGLSSASDTNKITAEASGTVAGLSSASGNPTMIYAANGTAQGLSDVSTIASAILNAMGTAQGQSNVTASEVFVYSASGTTQGVSNATGNELVIYLGSGTSIGSSSVSSNDTFTGVSGTTYSGSGTAVGGSNVSAVERMILAAAGTAQGASTITTHELITLMASGIASGYSTVTFVDNSMQIIGRIELKGERQLYVYLQGHRDLTINLKGSI
jgi:hypothetical protein